ncbi:MAG: DUF4397 domain-containing protein [Flavobacteriales bacterium]|nr:MAG: DUF4397 domain-containing protein [Flavobacteriales bacterium]
MKTKIARGILLISSLIIMLAGCEKKGLAVPDITKPITGAKVRLYNFAYNSPGVNFYANDLKISAVTSANGSEAVGGIAFGGTYPANQYALAPAGQTKFKAQTSSTNATIPNTVVASVDKDIEEDKYYSIFTSGVYNATTKTTDAFLIEDNFPTVADTAQANIRIVNSGFNTSTLDMILTLSKTVNGIVRIDTVKIASDVPYKSASQFVGFRPGAYSIVVTDKASGKKVTRAATSFLRDRAYTLALRGNLITGVPAAFIDNTVNR